MRSITPAADLIKYLLPPICFLLYTAIAAMAETDTKQQIFNPNFHTLKIIKNDNFMLSPTITLASNDFITFSFDEITDDYRQLQYKLIHCNADWQPSQLLESEYLDGFNIADIDDYAFSSNTFVHYVNYAFTIPDENMDPLLSGNYLVQVFNRYDPEDIILQARFSVSENAMAILGDASGRTDRAYNDNLQQLSFALRGSQEIVNNPYQDLIVTVTQNRRSDTMRTIPTPLRVSGTDIIYEHNRDLIFNAGNEYRRFETVRTDYPGMHVDSVRFGGSNYHAWLSVDQRRNNSSYNYDSTQQGRFFIREYNSTDSDLGADYVTCHFSLNYPYFQDAEIYLQGDFTQSHDTDRYRMAFNPDTRLWELQLPLKQGSYNYQYLVKNLKGELITQPIEGDKYETRNEYEVNVFMRTPTSRADRLITNATIISE